LYHILVTTLLRCSTLLKIASVNSPAPFLVTHPRFAEELDEVFWASGNLCPRLLDEVIKCPADVILLPLV